MKQYGIWTGTAAILLLAMIARPAAADVIIGNLPASPTDANTNNHVEIARGVGFKIGNTPYVVSGATLRMSNPNNAAFTLELYSGQTNGSGQSFPGASIGAFTFSSNVGAAFQFAAPSNLVLNSGSLYYLVLRNTNPSNSVFPTWFGELGQPARPDPIPSGTGASYVNYVEGTNPANPSSWGVMSAPIPWHSFEIQGQSAPEPATCGAMILLLAGGCAVRKIRKHLQET